MWFVLGKGIVMFKSKMPQVEVFIPKKALDAIYDECDQFQVDETGGRIIGRYQNKGKKYKIEVLGIIGPGPDAKRSATSFFQDGDYQEQVFREVERRQPDIEHLGNWHTHHVNGLATLSSGDRATYQRIVNHEKHNTDFFYAILVVEKKHRGNPRYDIKHFFLRRNDPEIYEIPSSSVRLEDKSILWPDNSSISRDHSSGHTDSDSSGANGERVKDQDHFSEFYPNFKPLFSKSLGAFYWKGTLELIDGSSIEIVIMESNDNGKASYSVAAPRKKAHSFEALKCYEEKTFKSARRAMSDFEKSINKEIFSKKEISA